MLTGVKREVARRLVADEEFDPEFMLAYGMTKLELDLLMDDPELQAEKDRLFDRELQLKIQRAALKGVDCLVELLDQDIKPEVRLHTVQEIMHQYKTITGARRTEPAGPVLSQADREVIERIKVENEVLDFDDGDWQDGTARKPKEADHEQRGTETGGAVEGGSKSTPLCTRPDHALSVAQPEDRLPRPENLPGT